MSLRNFDFGGKPKSAASKRLVADAPPLAPTNADWAWWQRCAAEYGDRADELTWKEREFILDMALRRREPSERQLAWLLEIFRRLFGKAPPT